MENLNPFNLLIKLVYFLYTIYAEVMTLFFKLWMVLAAGLLIWIVITIFIPGINFIEHLTMLFNMFVINPALYSFDFLTNVAEMLRVDYVIPEENGFKLTFFAFLWIAAIGASLVIAPAMWFGWIVCTYFGFASLLSGEAFHMFVGMSRGSSTASTRNIAHLVMGRTSFREVYDADVKANAIVDAFEMQKK